MQRGVVGTGSLSCCIVISTFQYIADVDNTLDMVDMMHMLLVRCFLHVNDICLECIIPQLAGICALAAAFGIEAGAGKNHITFVRQFIDSHAIMEQADDFTLAGLIGIAGEHTFLREVHQILGLAMHGLHIGTGISGSLLLQLHFLLKALFIHRIAGILGNLRGQLFREAIGIIQTEHDITRQCLFLFMFLHGSIEQILTLVQRPGKGFFLLLDQAADQGHLVFQIRIVVFHIVSDNLDKLIHESSVNAQLAAIAHRSAQYSAQDIASALIGEHGAIRNGKCHGTDMIGNDTVCHLVFRIRIRMSSILFCGMNDRQEEIGIEVSLTILNQSDKPFQTHAGINVLLRQFLILTARHFTRTAVVLGEDDIPDFDVAVILHVFKEQFLAQMLRIILFTTIIIDLGIGSARTSADFPEVIHRLVDMLGIHADLDPQIVGIGIIRIDGDIQALGIKADPFRAGQKLPCPGDGFGLEVVAD